MQKQRRKRYVFIMLQALIFFSMLNSVSYAFATIPEQEERTSEELPNQDFRFVTVEKKPGLFAIDVTVYEEMDEASRAIGTGAQGGVCYILKQVGEWLFIESGEVRGFVKSVDITRENIEKLVEESTTVEGRISLVLDIDEVGNITGTYFDSSHDIMSEMATPLILPTENKGFSYTQTTTQQVLIEKQHLIAQQEVNIAEYKNEQARVVGVLPRGGLAFTILEEGEWLYIESGNVRGFARAKDFHDQEEFLKANRPEEEYSLARQSIEPKENQSLYYTITSTKDGDSIRGIRESMATYAQQVTELGSIESEDGYEFMKSVYAEYGYSIPTTREEQTKEGKVVPIEQVRPGDIVFWTYNGALSDPAMYVGSEKILVYSSTEKTTSLRDMKTSGSVWAIDFLSPQIEEYLGEFKLTAYCKCSYCSGIWTEAPTASGVMPVEGRTVAMWGIPFGTSLLIDGEVYVVEDRGTPYGHVDIFMEDHDRCLQFGVKYADVSKLW